MKEVSEVHPFSMHRSLEQRGTNKPTTFLSDAINHRIRQLLDEVMHVSHVVPFEYTRTQHIQYRIDDGLQCLPPPPPSPLTL